jgi:hypothetical protein
MLPQTGSSPVERLLRNGTDDNVSQKETSRAHELALDFAMQCLKKFKEPVRTIEDVENQSCEAIRLLTKRHVHNVLHLL